MNNCKTTEDFYTEVFNGGGEYTSDVFILLKNVYVRHLVTTYTVKSLHGDLIERRTTQSDRFVCWCYKTGIRREVDAKTFYTQFKLFKYLKETHEDFIDDLVEEMLNNNLTQFAFLSEHMF